MESSQDGAVFFKFKSKSMKVRSFVDIARCRCVRWVTDYCLWPPQPRITEEVIRAHLEPAFGPLQSLCIKAHYWKPVRSSRSASIS